MSTINPDLMRLGGYAEFDGGPISVSAEKGGTDGFDRGLTIEMRSSALGDVDEVDPVVEAALTRTDELGGLMSQIFNRSNYPEPAMPDFANIS